MAAVGQVREAVADGGLLGDGPVLVLLSGGRDSTCLLDAALSVCGPERVAVLHVNYGLREPAIADEQHCRRLCRELGVPLEVLHARRGADAPGNLQAWARDLRYDAARARTSAAGGVLATGHTASDQVETILYRLAASPGRRALLGMPDREGALVRPLLALSREQTGAYCRERGLRWREDESNADPRFARSRVRAGLVPALASVHPAAAANVLRTAALLREESELLDGLVAAELLDGDGSSIALVRLAELPPALARLVVIRLAEHAAGTYVPQAGERVAELLELARRGRRAELHVGGGAGAVLEDGRLRMVRLPPRASSAGPHGQ